MRARDRVISFGMLLLVTLPVGAQQSAQRSGAAPPAQPQQAPEIQLVYEREIFAYSPQGRRDPFAPLTGDADLGPRFEELQLLGVLFSNIPSQSIALVLDASGKRYRVRQGDVVGNSRVIDISPTRVVFAVDNFGVVKHEQLDIRTRNREGASG